MYMSNTVLPPWQMPAEEWMHLCDLLLSAYMIDKGHSRYLDLSSCATFHDMEVRLIHRCSVLCDLCQKFLRYIYIYIYTQCFIVFDDEELPLLFLSFSFPAPPFSLYLSLCLFLPFLREKEGGKWLKKRTGALKTFCSEGVSKFHFIWLAKLNF